MGVCQGAFDAELSSVFRACGRLECFALEGTVIRGSILVLPTSIINLSLVNAVVEPKDLAHTIDSLTNLKTLIIKNPPDFTSEILQALTGNDALGGSVESLVLEQCNPQETDQPEVEQDEENVVLEDFIEQDLGPVEFGTSLPSKYRLVTDLSVAYSGWVDATFIEEVGTHMTRLVRLNITGCTNVRGRFALDPLGRLGKLTHLDMNYLFIDVGAQFLMDMVSLRELKCRDNAGVTGEDLSGLVRRCTTIEYIDAEGCVGVDRCLIDCVYSALRMDPHGHKLILLVGGTSARAYKRDRRFFHIQIHYVRYSTSPYN